MLCMTEYGGQPGVVVPQRPSAGSPTGQSVPNVSSVKVVDIADRTGRYSSRPGFGFIAHWNGHNESVAPGSQPRVGFRPDASGQPTPFGAILWWRQGRVRVMSHRAEKVAAGAAIAVTEGQSYQLRMSVTTPGRASRYRMKMWPTGADGLVAGVHQHYFANATEPMQVQAGDTLYAYVYLDPANPPRALMLQWNAGGSWEHRAYWGANLINKGADGTDGRRYMGPLPPTGQWVRLEVPANAVGLEGASVSGMAFTLYDGRVTWAYGGT